LKIAAVILVLFFVRGLSAQSPQTSKDIRAGNDYYRQQQFDKAAEAYDKAIQTGTGIGIANFNLGNTLHRQNKEEEAVKIFIDVANRTEKDDLKEKAFYNQGVVLTRQKKLEESIEAYKNALRLNPVDQEARENLQKALLELKKKNPPKKREDQEKKKQQEKSEQKQPQSKISPKEAQQRLQLLAQKEKEVQQRIQQERAKQGGSQTKDW